MEEPMKRKMKIRYIFFNFFEFDRNTKSRF